MVARQTAAEERARRYEAAHHRLFAARWILALALACIYQLSGVSVQLVAGLEAILGAWWPLVNAAYLLITLFGAAALLFPLTYYDDYVLERRYGLTRQSPESWFVDYLKGLALELGLGVVGFSVLYALVRFSPNFWWLGAMGAYVLFVVVLSALAPVLILPLFHKIEPLNDPVLAEAAQSLAARAGVQTTGIYRWRFQDKSNVANAALAGWGRTRRILLSDTLLAGYTREEILAILAHELGHVRYGDVWRAIASGTALAGIGFAIAHHLLARMTRYFGLRGPADIAGFPLMVICLFIFALVAIPFANWLSRRRELRADEYAARVCGMADPLITALNKLADQNLAVREPPRWIEFLLYSHPSIGRRLNFLRRFTGPG